MKEMQVGDKVRFPLVFSLEDMPTWPRFCFITLVAVSRVRTYISTVTLCHEFILY
jgi:hypothetical protein